MVYVLLALILACGEAQPDPDTPTVSEGAGPADAGPGSRRGKHPTGKAGGKREAIEAARARDTGCDASALSDVSLDATALNTAGYRCYKANALTSAATLFREAIARDPGHALAHYNLACTLALLRREGQICEHDAYVGTILDLLERSVELDEKRRARAEEDPDLAELRSGVRFQVLLGADLTDAATLERIVSATEFYGPPAGIYGNTTKLALQPGGQAVRQTLQVREEPVWTPDSGRWKVREGQVWLELGEESWQLTLDASGTLTAGTRTLWFNVKSECEA